MNRMIGGRGQTLRLGFIGLGKRGKSLLELLVEMPDVEIAAISDLYEDRLEEAARVVTDMGRPAPASCSDYREVIGREDVEAVIIASSWTSHSEIAIAAMQVGKPVASEVGEPLLWRNAGSSCARMKRPARLACCWKTAVTAGRKWRCCIWSVRECSAS